MSTVKDYSLVWSSVGLSVSLQRKIIKIEHVLFCRIIIVTTDASMNIIVNMNVIVD